MSARLTDMNGFTSIHANPISKVGVFPYLGRSICPSLDPDKMYAVYRPAEELSCEEAIASFKGLPLVDDHAMLGKESDGLTPAERYGVHGVIGDNVFFEDGYLKGNIKIFSEKMTELIDAGKKDLSAGYRCKYYIESGEFNGQKYDAVQRHIRGNHVALVKEGRMGKDVAVLDQSTFTIDAKEFDVMTKEELKAALDAAVSPLLERITTIEKHAADAAEKEKMDDEKEAKNKADKEAAEKEASEKEAKDKLFEKKEDKKDDKAATDAAEATAKLGAEIAALKAALDAKESTAQRDALAEKLSHHIGTFDHAAKSLVEVAAYGAEKLGLAVTKGSEVAALEGFLHKREKPVATAADAKPAAGSEFAKFVSTHAK